jgi:UDP-glucose 4-epimerase
LLARRNLIDAIHLALASPAAKGETYVVADPSPLTLAEIVSALRAGEGRRAGLLPVPPPFVALGAAALGRTEEWQRLGGRMIVDPTKLLNAGWKPTLDTRAGLAALARANAPSNTN